MKTYILSSIISLFILSTNAQIVKDKYLNIVCNNAKSLQQIGGPRVVLDPLLVYQLCINTKASDDKNPMVAKHLVGAVKVSNNSKSTYQLRVYYFWKGNQINTKLAVIKPYSFLAYSFNLTAVVGKENENPSVEVRSEQTKKLAEFPIIK